MEIGEISRTEKILPHHQMMEYITHEASELGNALENLLQGKETTSLLNIQQRLGSRIEYLTGYIMAMQHAGLLDENWENACIKNFDQPNQKIENSYKAGSEIFKKLLFGKFNIHDRKM